MQINADSKTQHGSDTEREVVEVLDAATIYAAYNPFRYEVEVFDFENETVQAHRFSDLTEAKKYAVRNG